MSKIQKFLLNGCKVHEIERKGDEGEKRCGNATWSWGLRRVVRACDVTRGESCSVNGKVPETNERREAKSVATVVGAAFRPGGRHVVVVKCSFRPNLTVQSFFQISIIFLFWINEK